MVQALPANQVTLRHLKDAFGLKIATDADFFPEWAALNEALSDLEQQFPDRVKANFTALLEEPPLLENSVKMVVLSPLLDLAGFYRQPYRLETETSIELVSEDEALQIRGRIDVLILKNRLWLLAIESKRSDFAAATAIPQALAYMLSASTTGSPVFGLVTNGREFVFLKAVRDTTAQYAVSRLFSLLNPGNELYNVLECLKRIGAAVV